MPAVTVHYTSGLSFSTIQTLQEEMVLSYTSTTRCNMTVSFAIAVISQAVEVEMMEIVQNVQLQC